VNYIKYSAGNATLLYINLHFTYLLSIRYVTPVVILHIPL